jgi:hypothetical protein
MEKARRKLMKSVALFRYSAVACAVAALATAAAHLANLSLAVPHAQLQLAWTLTKVLIQL